MAVFEYRALNAQGRQTKGLIDADSARAARAKLKSQGVFPTSISESKAQQVSSGGKRLNFEFQKSGVSISQLSVMTRQLATLVAAGMPLVESLKALGDQIDHLRLKRVLAEVTDRVNEGTSLADAMRGYPKIFPRLYVNMVASGEVSGNLDLVLERLADLLEAQAALKRKVTAAMTYPIMMIVLCCGVLVLLLAYVVPEITAIFDDQGMVLPLPTQIVITLSDILQSYWWLLLISIVLIVGGVRRYIETSAGRRKLDQLRLRLPIIGPLTMKLAVSRFARNLGTMLSSGIELLTALSIVKNIVSNVILEEGIDDAIVGVREGKSLAGELNKAEHYPRLLVHMVAIGEKTGQLEPMLLRAANSYESEVNAVISGLTSILEPILIIFLAGIVGGILASIMLPMLEMSSLSGI